MATKALKFILPNGKKLNVQIEETVKVETFINQLKVQELLNSNDSYTVKDDKGNSVSMDEVFGQIRASEFSIIDTASFSGFTIGNIATPRKFHQLGIFVLDGSGSMAEETRGGVTKAQAVNEAIRGLLTRFKVSKNRNDFSFAVVTFDQNAKPKMPITIATDVDDNDNYDPMVGHGGGTDIMQGLSIALQLAENHMDNHQAGGPPYSVVILLMTDGMDGNPTGTIKKAQEIKTGSYGGQTTIFTTYLGGVQSSSEAAKNHLKEIATDKIMGFKEVYDTETLRNFFIRSISSVSGVKV